MPTKKDKQTREAQDAPEATQPPQNPPLPPWPVAWSPEVFQALLAPFPWDEVEWLPRATKGSRCLAIAYIQARAVMRRLDAVIGPQGWSFGWTPVSPDAKKIQATMTVLGKTSSDAGEAAKEDEALKAAVSDGIKRVAVHFGVGRYLYYLPQMWVEYDEKRRQIRQRPQIDDKALTEIMRIVGFVGSVEDALQGQASASVPPEAPEDSPFVEDSQEGDDWKDPFQSHLCLVCNTPLTKDAAEESRARFGEALCVEHARQKFGKGRNGSARAAPAETQGSAPAEEAPPTILPDADEDDDLEKAPYLGEGELLDLPVGEPAVREGKIKNRIGHIAKHINLLNDRYGHEAMKQAKYRAFAVNNEGHPEDTRIHNLSELPDWVSHRDRMWDQVKLWEHIVEGVIRDIEAGKLKVAT